MTSGLTFFRREDVMVVLTTSPAGLGHVRVTEALRSGLPADVRSELIGIDDTKIQFFHRLTSRNRLLRKVGDFVQNSPIVEEVFTSWYRKKLRKYDKKVFLRISDLIKRRRPKPSVLIVISTHFGLAHKIARLKFKLSKKLKICVILCVVVTDDSPQKIWGVYGADYIFVPSKETKNSLRDYLDHLKVTLPSIIVSPYPVSPLLGRLLSASQFKNRQQEVQRGAKNKIQILLPISGAAVQLSYFRQLISYLNRKANAAILVVARDSSYTRDFLQWCQRVPSVEVIADRQDRDVVASYEKELGIRAFSLEITKPSEQSFKALLSPKQSGGVTLLFSEPVGRQESDNLAFLQRQGLMPDDHDQASLTRLYLRKDIKDINVDFLERASGWRGVLLPKRGNVAGRAILRLKRAGILSAMVNFKGFSPDTEINEDSVSIFWDKLGKAAQTQCT